MVNDYGVDDEVNEVTGDIVNSKIESPLGKWHSSSLNNKLRSIRILI